MLSQTARLLLVDDETKFLETLARRLRMREFEVHTAQSGVEALYQAGVHPIDVAIVDLKMPGMQGDELIEALLSEYPAMEVIVLTAHGSVQSAVECVRSGSRHYLQKPCETEALLAVIQESLEIQRRRQMVREELLIERIRAGEMDCADDKKEE